MGAGRALYLWRKTTPRVLHAHRSDEQQHQRVALTVVILLPIAITGLVTQLCAPGAVPAYDMLVGTPLDPGRQVVRDASGRLIRVRRDPLQRGDEQVVDLADAGNLQPFVG
jgi:hypothetical protein